MASPPSLTVLIADQDPAERALIRDLVGTLGWSPAEADSVKDITAWLRARPANDTACVLVSYPFPDGDAFDALAASRAIRADFPVVLLSNESDADVVLRLLNSGAAGFVERTSLSQARLGQAVRRAMRTKGTHGFGEHALLAAAFEQLPAALLITDRYGNVVLRNGRWIELLGQTLGTLDSVAEMLSRASATIAQASSDRAALLQALVEEQDESRDFTLVLDNHDQVLVRLSQSPIRDDGGQRVGNIALLEDLSQVQQPRVMQKACHDLRNPLSAILINANILSREAAMPNERRVKLATRIVSSATRMNRMLEDFFDYAIVAQGKALSIRPRDADLSLVASEALAEVRAEQPGRTLAFDTRGDLRGQWDPGRLRQMLHSLLTLALKRGSTRASLALECDELHEPPAIQIRMSIKHDSLNIDLAMPPRSVSEPTEDHEPGLYVARRIVEAHHGSFEAPAAGDATTFVVRLPKRQGMEDEKAGAERQAP